VEVKKFVVRGGGHLVELGGGVRKVMKRDPNQAKEI